MLYFFGGFRDLWMFLGSLPGPLEVGLWCLRSEKMLTLPRENDIFINDVFWFFVGPIGFPGLIPVCPGRIWIQNGFQNGFQKLCTMLSKECSKKTSKKTTHRVPKWVPKNQEIEIAGLRHFLPWVDFFLFFYFFEVLELFGCYLGTFLGLLSFFGRALDSKTYKNPRFFLWVSKRQFIGLWSSWCPSWAHLVFSWSNLVPKWGSKMDAKSGSERHKKNEFSWIV